MKFSQKENSEILSNAPLKRNFSKILVRRSVVGMYLIENILKQIMIYWMKFNGYN